MYKNVIFDIGGVMVDFDPKDFLLERFCNAAVEEKVYRLTFGSETWQKLDAGLCSRYEGSQAMLAAARAEGCAFEVQEVLENWTSILRIRRRMVELVRRLKNHGYCVYYLSNIPEDILPLLMRRLHRRQPRQRPDRLPARDEQHPDAGQRRHPGPQPGHLQRHPAVRRTKFPRRASFGDVRRGNFYAEVTSSDSSGRSEGSPPAGQRSCRTRSARSP